MNWDDLRFVLAATRHNGLSGAAKALGVNHATVARRITAAEDALQATLFDRLPSGYRPTDAGRAAARTATLLEEQLDDLQREIGARDTQVAGDLTVTAPQLLIEHIFAPILRDFQQANPDVRLSVLGSNEPLNLARREADVAIRMSNTPHQSLFGRKVADQKSAIYAHHDYLAQLQDDPDRRLAWLQFMHWTGILPEVKQIYPNAQVAMAFDDMTAMRGAVLAGLGATRMPCFLGDAEADLVRLPDLPLMPYMSIWVLTHADLRKVARIATFMGFVSERLQQLRPRFEGTPARKGERR